MKRKNQEYYDQVQLLKETHFQAFDEEILKMRKELFEIHKIDFSKNYEENEIERALEYFLATPSLQLTETKSYEWIKICFESARESLKNQ